MNLKQAARRLGIHYQTAYKLVRSGRLAAIRVGGGYEISEAALARYLAEREAVRRVPLADAAVSEPEPIDDFLGLLDAASSALGATTLSSRAVLDVVGEGLSRVLGDLAVVRPLSRDGRWLLPGSVHHLDPRRRCIATTEVDAFPKPASDGHEGVAIATRAPVFIPHVPQDRVRAQTRPELMQYLDEGGIHSLICIPAMYEGEVLAVVTVTRDTPGRPYTRDDVALVTKLAAVVGAAIARAHAAAEGWQRRHALMTAVANVRHDELSGNGARRLLAAEGSAEVVCDVEGVITCANAPASRLAGKHPEALVGAHVEQLASAAEHGALRELVERLLVGELTYADAAHTVAVSDGSERRIALHYGVVRNAAAEALALVVVAHELAEPEIYETAEAVAS
jgi:excisionase family DNA binding protein/PAS domain S-box-containing protein